MSLLRNWYLIQTAAVDPRTKKFDDKLMGDWYVCLLPWSRSHIRLASQHGS
jgi:hypothetical protein